MAELLAAAAGHDLDDAGYGLAHALRRETDGNPFFTAELLRHLGETGGIVLGDDGRWNVAGELDELGLPGSIRDVVGRRVHRLGDEALRVLCLAAVIGREFDVGPLAVLADVDEDALLDVMDAAVSAAVLVESGASDRYRFAHALIRHSLYDELSPARRARAHQRVAEALEAHAATPDAAMLGELAHHWVAATRPADLDKALGYVRRAGDAARDALAPDDAIRWYQQALELIDRQAAPDEHQRGKLLAALGAVQRQAGRPEYRETLLLAAALAERIDDTDLLVQTALEFRPASDNATVGDEDAKRVNRSALDRVGTDATPLRARLLATFAEAHNATLEWQTRRDLALQAVDTARQTDDDATFVFVIDTTQNTLLTPDRLEQNVADLERAVALADRISNTVHQIQTRYYLAGVRYQQCNLPAADRLIAELQGLAEHVGLPQTRADVAGAVTARLMVAGRIDEAEAANDRYLELASAAGTVDAFSLYAANLSNIRRQQGRLDEIVDFFLDVARDNPSIASLRAAIPAMLCELGRIDEARERLAVEAATNFEFPYDQTWMLGMSRYLEAAASTTELSAAHLLVDRVAPYATQVIAGSSALVLGAAARPLARAAAVLGEYDQAEEWFATAHDLHARLQAPFFTALSQLDHADLCLTRRADTDFEHARALATTAAATAAEYGYAGLTKRAAALLDAI